MNAYQLPGSQLIKLTRWGARLLCSLLLYLIFVLSVDEWIHNFSHLSITETFLLCSFLIMCAGFFVTWKYECMGSLLFFLGFVSFIILNSHTDHAISLGFTYIFFPVVSAMLVTCWWKSKHLKTGYKKVAKKIM